jgi:hypothetical protein
LHGNNVDEMRMKMRLRERVNERGEGAYVCFAADLVDSQGRREAKFDPSQPNPIWRSGRPLSDNSRNSLN